MTNEQTELERVRTINSELGEQVQLLEVVNKRLTEERGQLQKRNRELTHLLQDSEKRERTLLIDLSALRTALGTFVRTFKEMLDAIDAAKGHYDELELLVILSEIAARNLTLTVEERKLLGRLFAHQPNQEGDPDDFERLGDPPSDSVPGRDVPPGT